MISTSGAMRRAGRGVGMILTVGISGSTGCLVDSGSFGFVVVLLRSIVFSNRRKNSTSSMSFGEGSTLTKASCDWLAPLCFLILSQYHKYDPESI